jgi:hypothetical protein
MSSTLKQKSSFEAVSIALSTSSTVPTMSASSEPQST